MVVENIFVGLIIIIIVVIDVDLGFFFEILYEFDLLIVDGFFVDFYIMIYLYFGDIILKCLFDFEVDDVLFMIVIVKDGDFFLKLMNINVIIYVIDVNDNLLEFFFLFYNVEVLFIEVCEFIIIIVIVMDRDQINNVELFYLLDLVDE